MKFKNFLLSCSPGVHRKRLEEASSESRYVNLRPISKRTSVPDFQSTSVGNNSHGMPSSSTSKGNKSNKSSYKGGDLKHSNSTSNFYVNCASHENEHLQQRLDSNSLSESSRAVFEPTGLPLPVPYKEAGLKKGDRVIWAREETGRSEAGVVKWIGTIKDEVIAGIEFDNPLGLGSGWYDNHLLFPCQRHHGGLVAVAGLILEKDYFSTEPGPSKRDSFAASSSATVFPSESTTSNVSLFYPPPQRSPSTKLPPSSSSSIHTPATTSLGITPLQSTLVDPVSSLAATSASLRSLKQVQVPCNSVLVQSLSGLRLDESFTMAPRPYVKEPLKEEDAERFSGRSKGIQGNRNSCYLDATLFSMFSFSSVFDSILLQNYLPQQQFARDVQRILREEIVNPLRKDLFCPAQNVMKLREKMVHLDDKLTTAEMDPAEFLQILFKQVLELNDFIKLSSNESDFFHQVLVQATDKDHKEVPTIQRLFEQSLIMQQLKLKAIPSPALILQMPRSGNKYKMYSGIFPNLTIDITDLVENTPRTCVICGELATSECPDCYDRFTADNIAARSSQGIPIISGAESTAYCETCIERLHKKSPVFIAHRQNFTPIEYTFDTSMYFQSQPLMTFTNGSSYPIPSNRIPSSTAMPTKASRVIPRITLNLFAVICIETSHFVSFVKCGTDRTAPWAFFDSMADRVENPNGSGHNIPQVKLLPNFGTWLDQLEREPDNLKASIDSLTPEMRRFLADPYICIYYSPQMSMYR